MSETKTCKECGKSFRRSDIASISRSHWAVRKFCSILCSNASYKHNRPTERTPKVAPREIINSCLCKKSRAEVKRFFDKCSNPPVSAPAGNAATWGALGMGITYAEAQRQIANMRAY